LNDWEKEIMQSKEELGDCVSPSVETVVPSAVTRSHLHGKSFVSPAERSLAVKGLPVEVLLVEVLTAPVRLVEPSLRLLAEHLLKRALGSQFSRE